MVVQNMRPKWKTDTYSIPISDGVYLRGNNNRLILKGKSLYPLLEHLVPNLDGNVTLEEITAGLDADRKRMLTRLIEKLLAHNFLQDVSQDQHHTLHPLELETYASDIGFIESFQTSPASRFEYFRNKHLLLIGSGLSLASLVQVSLQCGVKQTDIAVTREDETDASFRQAVPASEQTLRLIDTPSWEDEAEVRKTMQNYDAVLHIAERPMLARAQMLNRLCVDQQKVFIQAILVDNHAWVGPLVCPETGSCWECAWRRLQANLTGLSEQRSRYALCDQPLAPSSPLLTPLEATMLANRLFFSLFQHFTRTGSTAIAGKISAIHLETFLSESHSFLPHPYCLACHHPAIPTASQFLEQVQQLRNQAPLDSHTFLENVADCIDEKFGLFAAPDASHFAQVPLAVYSVHLSDPLPGEGPPTSRKAVAVSIDTREARMRALQKACERYAASFVDQRRLLPNEALQQSLFSTSLIEQLIGVTTLVPVGEMWTWALNLQTQQASLVPAMHVFSALCEQERGIGSGRTLEEAICQALMDWCNCLTIERLQDTQQPYLQVDLERMPMTPEGGHLYRLLKAAVEQIIVYDVTGLLGVPTFATCLNEKVVAYSTHCDGAQALSMGLEQALRQYQSAQFQQPDYALAPVPDCPANLRGNQRCLPRYALPEAWSGRREWLLQQLRASGFRAFAIPLDHDPALTQVLPFIVRVLLSDRELKKGE